MKKIKISGKLQLNKEVISELNKDELNAIQGGRITGSIGVRCTQPAGTCVTTDMTKGWACNDDIVVASKPGYCW